MTDSGRYKLLPMREQSHDIDDARVADNLRRTIELTELGLALRRSVLQEGESNGDAMTKVMREIRRAKEQAWQRNLS